MTEPTRELAGIRSEAVTRWFAENLPSLTAPLHFERIGAGHSNLTYRVTDASGAAVVLRRPPLGHVLESAHDMGREYKALAAIGPTGFPVPRVHAICRDKTVNDAPFYVMELVDGVVLDHASKVEALSGTERRELGFDLVDVLARLHGFDPDEIGLGDLGKREAYVARQLRRWHKQWEASKTRELPDMDEARRLLEEHLPEQVGATVVHGDFRFGNTLGAGPRIAAVLDWEICTLGDPLSDLAYLLNDWISPGEQLTVSTSLAPTAAGGFPSREEILARYAEKTGRDVSRIGYYRAFNYWRSAAILEGVLDRYQKGARGKAEGLDLEAFSEAVAGLAHTALEQLHV